MRSFCALIFLHFPCIFLIFVETKYKTEIIAIMRKNIFLLGAAVLMLLTACGQRGQYDAQWKLIDSLADVRPKEADSLLRDLALAMAEAAEVDRPETLSELGGLRDEGQNEPLRER